MPLPELTGLRIYFCALMVLADQLMMSRIWQIEAGALTHHMQIADDRLQLGSSRAEIKAHAKAVAITPLLSAE